MNGDLAPPESDATTVAPPPPSPPARRWVRSVATTAVVAVLAVCGAVALTRPGARAEAVAAKPGAASAVIPVRVEVARRTDFAPTVSAQGALLPNESVEIVADVSRRLLRIHFEDGQEVKRGAPLFTLDSSELVAQRDRLAADRVLAQRTFDRQDRLKQDGLVSEQDWDVAKAKVVALAAQQREVESVLVKTQIVAPFAGRLGIRRVSEGAWVTATTPLVSLYDTKRLKLDFRLPERYAGAVRVGQDLTFQVDGRAERFAAKIGAIEPGVEAATRSVVVRGLVEEPQGLAPGAFAVVELTLPATPAIFVPSLSVLPVAAGHRVYVASDGKARPLDVELGARTADRVEIVRGLEPGARVIVSNMLRVRPGAAVEIEAPGAPGAAGK